MVVREYLEAAPGDSRQWYSTRCEGHSGLLAEHQHAWMT